MDDAGRDDQYNPEEAWRLGWRYERAAFTPLFTQTERDAARKASAAIGHPSQFAGSNAGAKVRVNGHWFCRRTGSTRPAPDLPTEAGPWEWVPAGVGVLDEAQPTRWCPECRSAGVVGIEQDVCPTCDGTGKVAAPGVKVSAVALPLYQAAQWNIAVQCAEREPHKQVVLEGRTVLAVHAKLTAGVEVRDEPSDTERLRMVLHCFGKREDNVPRTPSERDVLHAFDARGEFTDSMRLRVIDSAIRAARADGVTVLPGQQQKGGE